MMVPIFVLTLWICFLSKSLYIVDANERRTLKQTVKSDLEKGSKMVAELLSDEKDAKIFNNIYRITDFLKTINNLARFLKDVDLNTEKINLEDLVGTFINANRRIGNSLKHLTWKNVPEISYEVNVLNFSLVTYEFSDEGKKS